MSGINTVSGLRNVSIDYRPQVGPDAAKGAGAQQQAPDEIAGRGDNIINTGARPQADKAKSIVRKLDTLLLNAEGKRPMAEFDAAFEACRAKFPAALSLRDAMKAAGFDADGVIFRTTPKALNTSDSPGLPTR